MNSESWAKRLHSFCEQRQSFITAPHTFPVGKNGDISTQAVDWIDFRFLDSALDDWLELEAAASLLHAEENGKLFEYESFPTLRSVAPEVFAKKAEYPLVQAAPEHTFITLRWRQSRVHSLACSLFASYLLHRRYEPEGEVPFDIFEPIYSPSHLGPGDPSSDYIRILLGCTQTVKDSALAEHLEVLSEEVRVRIYEETLESFRLLEHVDAYRQRLSRLGCHVSTDCLDLILWSVLTATFKPFMTRPAMPLTPMPNPGSPNRQTQNTNTLYKDHPRFFRSVNPDELMIETVASHFESKAETAYEDIAVEVLKKSNKNFGWSFIENQHRTDYSYFFSEDRTGSFSQLQRAASQHDQKQVVATLPITNAISCNGRLGAPLRYYEWIDADSRLLAADVCTSAAFALLAAGYEIVLVSPGQIVIHVPLPNVESTKNTAVLLMERVILAALAPAFPTDHPPVKVYEYFVHGKINVTVGPTWPNVDGVSKNLPEEPDEEHQGIPEIEETVEYREISSEVHVLREAAAPGKKRFRKRKNSKPKNST